MGSCSANTWRTLPTYSSSLPTSVTGVRERLAWKRPAPVRPRCSDARLFCQGNRFHYTYYDEAQGEIYRSIEHLDKMVT